MLSPGRIPLNAAEEAALEALLESQPGRSLTLTRRDPGDTGPLLVQSDDGAWEINEEGEVRLV
jgi:hypothetical protein